MNKGLRTLTSGDYILGATQVTVEVGRSGTIIKMGIHRLVLDSALPKEDGSWLVRFRLGSRIQEEVMTAAT